MRDEGTKQELVVVEDKGMASDHQLSGPILDEMTDEAVRGGKGANTVTSCDANSWMDCGFEPPVAETLVFRVD